MERKIESQPRVGLETVIQQYLTELKELEVKVNKERKKKRESTINKIKGHKAV